MRAPGILEGLDRTVPRGGWGPQPAPCPAQGLGSVLLNVQFVPFFQPSYDDEAEHSEGGESDDEEVGIQGIADIAAGW